MCENSREAVQEAFGLSQAHPDPPRGLGADVRLQVSPAPAQASGFLPFLGQPLSEGCRGGKEWTFLGISSVCHVCKVLQ